MKKTYEPSEIEQPIYESWEKNNYFEPSHKGKAYCIMLPPPNITGSLHMGHGFSDILMDTLIRYHRMRGFNTLWQPGTDHASISTQMVVERQLNAESKTRHDLGREKFIERTWEWKEESGGRIMKQLRRLGTSLDWPRSRFTMDEGLSDAVKKAFVQLYDEGLIYRGKRLVHWDPVLQTAVSDLEVNNEQEQGFMWHIRYPLADESGYLVIATTRPETLLGDTAVAIHPDDERYKHLKGKKIKLPLTDREIPIITDEHADPTVGTGCVKITPAHDYNDYAVGQRHDLPLINILTADAHLNENTPKVYQGLDRFEAREKIVNDLKKCGLLEKTEKHLLSIPRSDRTKTIIEPLLTEQWYVKIEPLAKPAIEVVENGQIKFIPDNWKKTYFQWMYNIEDWCISRQLWWGHRIPAWYDDKGNIYVANNEEEVRKKYQLKNDIHLKQDDDVLDTWFSSAFWPFSTLGWPDDTPELHTFYPTNVMITGFDIIFFWVARMIMFGLKFMKQIPFLEVYIHGLIRDEEGQKMSKTKGNVIDPIDLIDGIDLESLIKKRTYGLMQPQMKEEIIKKTKKQFPQGIPSHGTDALRLTYTSLATLNRDIRFDLGRLQGYRNFCNKLWNATRYVLMQLTDENKSLIDMNCSIETCLSYESNLTLSDRWILSRLEKTIQQCHDHFKNYRFDLLTQSLHEFTWHEYCDWYLELIKPILLSEDTKQKQASLTTLIVVLDCLLKLLHPLIPFITESLWQSLNESLGKTTKTIMLAPYPEYESQLINEPAEEDLQWMQQFILGIRNIRGEMNIAPGKRLAVILDKGTSQDKKRVLQYSASLLNLAKLDSIEWLDNKTPPLSATALAGSLEIYIPMAGLIDIDAEKERLKKEINKLEMELGVIKTKLENPNFANKAPKEIVEKDRERLTEIELAVKKLNQQFEKLKQQ